MPKGKKLTEKRKLDLLKEICNQLDIEYLPEFSNAKNKTVSAAALEAILQKTALFTGVPPKGLSKDKEMIWRLLQKSQDSFVLALEIINKITVPYRIESFCFLFITAWELLMKAKIIQDSNYDAILDKSKSDFTIGFGSCLKKIFHENTPEYKNLEIIENLRNEATHLFINFIPNSVMFVFSAGVRNYDNKLKEWFEIDITRKIPEEMMFLLVNAETSNYSEGVLRKNLSAQSLKYINDFNEMLNNKIQNEIDETELGKFFLPIKIDLAFVNNPLKADTVQYLGKTGPGVTKVFQVKNPDEYYSFFTKQVVETLHRKGITDVTSNFICQVVLKVYDIKKDNKFYYKSAKHNRPQYSQAFVEWVSKKIKENPNFVTETKQKYKLNQTSSLQE